MKLWTVAATKNNRVYVFTFSTSEAAHEMAKSMMMDGCDMVEVLDPV